MPKISSLPDITNPDSADELPILDSSESTTKRISLTKIKAWLQTLTNFITTAMITDGAVTTPKVTNPYKFWAYRNGNYDIANNAVVALNAVIFDTNNDFNTSTYDYVVPVDGYYQFNFAVHVESINGTGYFCQLVVNGAEFARSSGFISAFTNTGFWNGLAGSALIYCSAGDLVDLRYVGNGTTSNNTLSGIKYATYLSGYLVSET